MRTLETSLRHPVRRGSTVGTKPKSAAALLLFFVVAIPLSGQAQRSATGGAFEDRRNQSLATAQPKAQRSQRCIEQTEGKDKKCVQAEIQTLIYTYRFPARDIDKNILADAIRRIGALMDTLDRKPGEEDQETGKKKYNFSALDAPLLARVYFLAPKSVARNDLAGIARVYWRYARANCHISDTKDTWRLLGTENLDLRRKEACWLAAEVLKRAPVCGDCRYEDGSSPVVQLKAWTDFFNEYIRQRVKHGGLIEYFAPNYTKYTLDAIYNLRDFATDETLKRLAGYFLDVWWAEWAEETVDGVHGGSETRANPDLVAREPVGRELAWLYFGAGDMPKTLAHPSYMVMKTSSYRPPQIVQHILDGRKDAYEVRSRRVGLVRAPQGNNVALMAADAPAVLRYAYMTPSFAMSMSMVPRLPLERWASFSSQNRWNGITLAGLGDRHISARPLFAGDDKKSQNDTWGVQHFGAAVMQKLPQPFNRKAAQMAVTVGRDLPTSKDGVWVFINSSAYVAFRPVDGDFTADSGRDGKWVLTNDSSPVIVQVAERSQFRSFEDFKYKTKATAISNDGRKVSFRGLGPAGTLTLYSDGSRLPEIDGKPVNLAPAYAFESPYLQEQWNSGLVTISYGAEKLVRDFR